MQRTYFDASRVLYAAVLLFAFCGCNYFGGSEYTRLVKKEMAKGERHDSLFLGLSMGMSRKAFFDHCWQLNKKGILTNGGNNTTALFKVEKDLKYPASMDFYPDFYGDKISRMKVSFQYDGWAPWNPNRSSDSLFSDVLQMYQRWYPSGNKFIKITNKQRGIIYVKVDGNRRITIGKFSDAVVKVDYADLLIEEKLKQ